MKGNLTTMITHASSNIYDLKFIKYMTNKQIVIWSLESRPYLGPRQTADRSETRPGSARCISDGPLAWTPQTDQGPTTQSTRVCFNTGPLSILSLSLSLSLSCIIMQKPLLSHVICMVLTMSKPLLSNVICIALTMSKPLL